MKSLKVALLQIMPKDTIEENMHKGIEYCRKAKLMGADIALFPEMWSTGYSIPSGEKDISTLSIAIDDEFVNAFRNVAKELDMAIAVTILEKYEPSARNSMVLIDRHGEVRFIYAKVHTCAFGESEYGGEDFLVPGEDFYVCELDTNEGKVNVGAMICFDREFPESARILMLKGAEIILVPNACPMEQNRIAQLRGRAFETMCGIATCNYPYGHPDCNGHSNAFDGMPFRIDGSGHRDMLVIEAGEREGIYIADFDIESLRAFRDSENVRNTLRKPEKYKLISE